MAAPIDQDGKILPFGKLVFEKSNFKHTNSKHIGHVDDHYFNYSNSTAKTISWHCSICNKSVWCKATVMQRGDIFVRGGSARAHLSDPGVAKMTKIKVAISCVLPNCSKVPEVLHSKCIGEKSYIVHDLPLVELICSDMIEAFIKRGKLSMLSHDTCIDSDDCVAILPTGHLILNLSKDTYQQLGIEGTPSQFPKRKKSKYIVDIDLSSPSFRPGKKGYNRVKWCLTDRLNLRFNFLVTWTPTDDEVCSSSIKKYFVMKGYKSVEVKAKCNMRKYTDVLVPDIDPSKVDFEKMDYTYNDVFEWLGGISNGIDLTCDPDGYLSTYSFSGPTLTSATCSCVQYKGFFSGLTVQCIIQNIRDEIMKLKAPWCSVTVQGFMDSPVSWKHREHGFLNCGDNLYTFIIFPDDYYWLYSAYGMYDLVS